MDARLPALALVAFALGGLGCGDDEEPAASRSTATSPASAPGVPGGVAAQYRQIEEEVGAEGGETRAGAWRIAYIVEPAEGWFERRRGALHWRAPAAAETHHIEILPIEAKTGRLVPDVPITVAVSDSSGRQVARKRLSFYYAELFHYAANFAIPRAGRYTLKAEIAAPDFRRHGEERDAPPLANGANVEFDGVELKPERG